MYKMTVKFHISSSKHFYIYNNITQIIYLAYFINKYFFHSLLNQNIKFFVYAYTYLPIFSPFLSL